MSGYTFTCRQLFNEFGAPGIPNRYRAVLFRDGVRVGSYESAWRRKAERQCKSWRELYGATPH